MLLQIKTSCMDCSGMARWEKSSKVAIGTFILATWMFFTGFSDCIAHRSACIWTLVTYWLPIPPTMCCPTFTFYHFNLFEWWNSSHGFPGAREGPPLMNTWAGSFVIWHARCIFCSIHRSPSGEHPFVNLVRRSSAWMEDGWPMSPSIQLG